MRAMSFELVTPDMTKILTICVRRYTAKVRVTPVQMGLSFPF